MFDGAHAARQHRLVEGHLVGGAAAFGGALCARAFHQDLPHGVGGDPHEVGPVLHVEATRAHEPRPRLIGERRRLQRVSLSFVPHLAARDPAQLVVDERCQLVERIGVALPRRSQEPHERIGIGGGHGLHSRPPDVRRPQIADSDPSGRATASDL